MAAKRIRQWEEVMRDHPERAQNLAILRQEWSSKYDPYFSGFIVDTSGEANQIIYDDFEDEDYRGLIAMREDDADIESGDIDNLWNEEGRFEEASFLYPPEDDGSNE